MMEWFNQRERREQVVLVLGAVLAILIIGWSFVWSPLRDNAVELSASTAERARQVVDLRRAAGLNTSSAPALATDQAPNLIFLVDETARPLGLNSNFIRTNPDGADAITISFREARFDRLISWLVDLEQTYGVYVVTSNFSRSGNSGLVSGQIRLDRS